MKLQEKVFAALSANLNIPVVVKYVNEYSGSYPVVVFNEIENVPIAYGDNAELLRKITYQISIGTENDSYENLEKIVFNTMLNLGFGYVDATETFNKVFWRELKFVIFKEVT